jgi:hypothetical protein
MQRNPGCKTIEGDLHTALVTAGGISADNADDFAKVFAVWVRRSRSFYLYSCRLRFTVHHYGRCRGAVQLVQTRACRLWVR